MPPKRVADHAGQEDAGGKQRHVFQVLVLVLEILRDPAQEQPQGPAIAEVDDGDRRHALEQRGPTAPAGPWPWAAAARRILPTVMPGWSAGFSRKTKYQIDDPDKAEGGADKEGGAPAISHHHRTRSVPGASALPSRAAEWVMPCAKPRSLRRPSATWRRWRRGRWRLRPGPAARARRSARPGRPPSRSARSRRGPDQAADDQGAAGAERSLTQPPMIWNTR